MNVPHVILEAKDRIGGRAYSESHSLGYLWDHGCHWFHSADKNPLRKIAERLGHGFVQEMSPGRYQSFIDGKRGPDTLRDSIWEKLEAIRELGFAGDDVPAHLALDPNDPLYGLVRHWATLMYSVEPEQLSTRDASNYEITGIDLPVRDGYGALLVRLAAGLPIALNSSVHAIVVGPKLARVETDDGTLSTKAVILTVPLRCFEREMIRISPRLHGELSKAFQTIRMGWYEKIALSFDRRVFDPGVSALDTFTPDPRAHPCTWQLHPYGSLIAIAHIAGDFAREMAIKGEQEMVQWSLEGLTQVFGSEIRKRVLNGVTTHWGTDPHIGGAYSAAKPGHADDRRHFLTPAHERIFIAGEHASLTAMTTAHGAFLSGMFQAHKAAERVGYETCHPDPLWVPAAHSKADQT
jgi:monoamine oxidase